MKIGIVGAGIFGLAAALELRERGHDVVVFEQGEVPNERASSTDLSKTIRRAYADKAVYVELAERAAPVWQKWHEQLGRNIYFQIGQLQIERSFEPGSRVYDSYHFFRRRGNDVRLIPIDEVRGRFPQFSYEESDTCVFDAWAGYLASGQAVGDIARLAQTNGVTIRPNTKVERVVDGSRVADIVVSGEALPFDRVVIAAGPWLGQLVPIIGRTFRPTFQQMAFYDPPDHDLFAPGPMPVWSVEIEESGWYGHPLKAQRWLKVANDLLGTIVDPDVPREATPEFLASADDFVARRIPSLAGHRVGSRACVYENTPDRDFVIDWVPGSQHILAAGGGSGHGFKFGGSIGPVIADALEDKSNRLGDLFRMGKRFDGVDRRLPL
jgi:glycine/D-amino acid oxidase-like deaminating enzyme